MRPAGLFAFALPALVLIASALLAAGCGGSGPSALASRAHEDARIAERMVESRPGAAARRFVDAGDAITTLADKHPGHPLTEELQQGDAVGGVPRPVFERRLAVARRVMGEADLLDAAVDLMPPPPKGLARLNRRPGPRAVDRLRAALIAAGRPIPPAIEEHGPSTTAPDPDATPLPAPVPQDAAALEARWRAVRAHRDADVWLVAALPHLQPSQRFVWARALHRGRSWQALAAMLLTRDDRAGAERALGFALERSLLEGLDAPLRPDGWLPVHLDRTLVDAGRLAEADRVRALYAAGLARAAAVADNGVAELEGKAEALADRAVEAVDPVAAGWLSGVVRRDLLDEIRRRARRPGRDPAVVAAHTRATTLTPAERAEPALAATRAMAPALAAAAAAHGAAQTAPTDPAGLSPADRVVFHLAWMRLDGDAADAHLGDALAAAAELPDAEARVDAVVDAAAVRASVGLKPGPHTRASLARLLFSVVPAPR